MTTGDICWPYSQHAINITTNLAADIGPVLFLLDLRNGPSKVPKSHSC